MQRRTGNAAVVGLAIWVLGACVADPLDVPELPATSQEVSALGGACPDWGCGANSPVIDVVAFHDLRLVGTSATGDATEPNDAGYAIEAVNQVAQIDVGGAAYDLAVVDGRFQATRCGRRSCRVLWGEELVGARIPIRRGEAHYVLTIESVREMSYFVGGGAVEAYELSWQALGGGGAPMNLCNNITELEEQLGAAPGGIDGPVARGELMGLRTFEAVVFEGDRISSTAKTMSPTADDSWFNIGCAGQTLSKLRLTRNTIHSQTPGLGHAWEQRQATLKMLTADYCDTGDALTVGGQRLVWLGDLMTYLFKPIEFEARWTERGATCLDVPRMLSPTSALGAATFPKIWHSITTACAAAGKLVPPPCGKPAFDDFAGAERISANP